MLTLFFLLIISNLLVVQFGGNFNLNHPYINKDFNFEAPTFITSFMVTFSRPWELLIGVFVSLYEWKYGRFKGNKFIANIITLLSITLIVYAVFSFDNKIFYPSFYTLIPVISTAFLIFFCNEDNIVKIFFSRRLIVHFGLISFSLYLWHYIILVFYRFYYITDEVKHKFILIILSIIISFFSYRYIEKPFRNYSVIGTKLFLFYAFISVVIVSSLAFFIIYNNGFPNKLNNKYKISGVEVDNGLINEEMTSYFEEFKPTNLINTPKQKVLLIGNSFGKDLYVGFKLNYKLYPNYDFYYWDTQFHCLAQYFSEKIDRKNVIIIVK